jgi:hypothetical protein
VETGQVVLRVDERKGFSSQLALLSRGELDKAASAPPLDAGPAVQLIARDSFVAETASKIEQMQATIRLLTRDVGELAGKVAGLQDTTDQEHRWYAFQQSERRTREARLEEMVRCCRDLKARLDRIEGRSAGNYHAYNSFEAVSRKLAELEHFRDEAQRVERNVTLRAWLFCGALLLAAAIVVASTYVSG